MRAIGQAGWWRTLAAAIVSLIYFFPVLYIILIAFKTRQDALDLGDEFFFTPTFDNFRSVFFRAAYYQASGASDTGFTCTSSTACSSAAPACCWR